MRPLAFCPAQRRRINRAGAGGGTLQDLPFVKRSNEPRPFPRKKRGEAQRFAPLAALIDTRLKIPGESIGTVVSTHETIRGRVQANEAFQKRMRDSGVKDHVPTKIVTLKVRLGDGVNPAVHLFGGGGT